jgi:hypothetical protein
MALLSTQPLKEMSTRNILGMFLEAKERPARKANNLAAIYIWADFLENVGTSTSHNPMGLHGLLQDTFTLYFTFSNATDLYSDGDRLGSWPRNRLCRPRDFVFSSVPLGKCRGSRLAWDWVSNSLFTHPNIQHWILGTVGSIVKSKT